MCEWILARLFLSAGKTTIKLFLLLAIHALIESIGLFGRIAYVASAAKT